MTVGNFIELLGTDGFDSISGSDLEVVYALNDDDVLNSSPTFNGGNLPEGGATTILVGGSDNNDYQIRNNSTAVVIENSNTSANILWTTIGSPGISLENSSSFVAEIDNRHLYLGNTESDQYVILIDWQLPENQIETINLTEGDISYPDFVASFRQSDNYRGNFTWSELAASGELNLDRLGISVDSIDNDLASINTRATELETGESEIPGEDTTVTELLNVTQLTDNNLDDTFPFISEDNIVWNGNDGNDSEIFFYDGISITQVTDNQLFDTSPQISGTNLVWLQTQNDPLLDPSGSSEVIFYNGTTEISLASIDGITVPAIEGNNVVWGENLIFGGGIFLYNGIETIQLSDSGVFNPVRDRSISGENIVWTSGIDLEQGTNNVFLHDGTNTTQITNDGLLNLLPVVSGNSVAWSAANPSVEEDTEVYFFDGNNTIQLTDNDNDTFDIVGAIDGNNVIWVTGDLNSGTQAQELFLYDGGETIQLSDGNPTTGVFGLDIEDGNVTWAESDGNDLELFLYNGNNTTQITNNEVDDNNPNLEDNRIVWERSDGNDTEIFLANLNSADDLPDSQETATVYRFFNNNSGVHFYTANETERDAVLELDNFSFEGASYFGVDPLTGEPEPVPVYRFLNQDTGVHLYTISEIERDAVEELDNFSFEGEAFFAYESEVEGSIPIYRFFNNTSGAHFYTPSAGERDNVEANLPEFASEGIAYYALPLEE